MTVTLDALENARPSGGLFAGKNWLSSPEPLRLSRRHRRFLDQLGPTLAAFQKAQDRIYRRSVKGGVTPWVAEVLDQGKPDWLLEWQRRGDQAEVVPRVIRPDLLLTSDGFAVSELDSVPGGIGLTAWLNQSYPEVIGGSEGMVEGFRSILPKEATVWVSEESQDYRPEMEWLCEQLQGVTVSSAEDWDGSPGYRFFELFDWQSIFGLAKITEAGNLTPPLKPHFEEKAWLALLHAPGLRKVWQQELRGKQLELLKACVPLGWVVDPAPLPPQASFPGMELQSWQEVGELSQQQRRLVLKISGFSEQAWGSRGVFVGHDEPGERWAQLVQQATEQFGTQPWMMQRFCDAEAFEHPYFHPETGKVETMEVRARLCPYYFINSKEEVGLGGCLATLAPVDKKKIHGMEDAILVPVADEASLR